MNYNRRITLAALLIIFLTLFGVSFLGHRIKRHFEDNGMRERAEVKVFKRLPTSVVPINYELTIKPDLKELTFSGTQSIDVIVIEEIKHILLNSLKLEIISASFSLKNGKILKADKIEISEVNETLSLQFSQNLSLGTGQLNLEFNGLLNNIMEGFYRTKYLSSDGQEERYAAVTHFEATHARRAFPCWDEPALKSTFEVTLIAPKNRVTLSNMNVISETPGRDDPKNLKEVKFSKTPLMSTYLLAFIIGEFDYVEQKGSNGVLIRVYTPVGKKDQGLFALNVANKALAYYEEYFNIEYPLPKMDLIAIPDFYAGAMENWGLITFREDSLLCESQNTSVGQKQKIVLIIAHELAHQWFGNLVTMEWWTHLWLNEGFASFISYLCIDDLFKQYSIWSDFVIDKYRKALELDALYNSHPIEVEVSNPSEIEEIFDDITYWKGETVLRMLHNYIGDKNFRKGLNLYLSKYKFKNTITENLWSALEEVSDKPVRDMMRSWTKQKGFPVLSVTSRDTNNNTRVLTITQEKFSANGNIPKTESDLLWIIPISISTEFSHKNTAFDILMDRKTIELEIPNLAKDEWIKLNTNSVGFYRVQYSQEMFNLLINSVSDKSQPPFDRFQINNDLFAFVKAGRASTVELLKLMQVFYDEDSYVVWYSINSCLERVDTLLSNTEIQPLFHSFGCKLLANSYARLGWDPIEGENHLDTLLRSLVIDRLANFRDETVIAEAKRKFWDHFWGKSVIIANLREAVYKAVAVDCDEKTFEAFLKLYRETDLDEEKNRISSALGSVSDTYLIKKVLKFSLSKEVKNHNFVDVINAVALTTNGRVMAWELFKEYKDELKNRYGPGFLLSKLVKGVIENFATEKKAQEIETFFAENPFPGAERTIKQSLENVRLSAEWLSRDFNSIHNFLNSQLI